MNPLPPDYYQSEAEDLAADFDYGITQPQHPAISRANVERDCSTTETDNSWDPYAPTIPANTVSTHVDKSAELEGDATDSTNENLGSGSAVGLADMLGFSLPDLCTPPWLRAEEAGMSPISPWRQTCDISPSRHPPPSKSGPRQHESAGNPA